MNSATNPATNRATKAATNPATTAASRSPARILVVATRQIGDVLVTTPLIRAIRHRWPEARIDVLGYEKTMGMLAGNPDISEVIESAEHPTLPQYMALIRRCWRAYDLAFVTQISDRAHAYGLLFARARVGMVPASRRHAWWKRALSLHSVQIDYMHQHALSEKLQLMTPFARGDLFSEGVAVVPPAPEALPADLAHLRAQALVVFHATPMWRYKRWPAANWAALARELIARGFQVALTGSASPQDRQMNAEIAAGLKSSSVAGNSPLAPAAGDAGNGDGTGEGRLIDLSGRLSLAQVGTLLRSAQLFVGVDTSVTHLAAACGTPTVAIFGPTPPTNFGPWPQGTRRAQPYALVAPLQQIANVALVQGQAPCVPCRKSGCDNHFDSRSDCLDQLAPARVLAACERMIATRGEEVMAT